MAQAKYVAYVGSYTHEKSKGIHIFNMDVKKGRISEMKEIQCDNPSFIALANTKNVLYSIVDEGVAAFAILEDGDLELMNVKSINGMRGCHISVTKDDRFLVVSGYHDGKITVMHINSDGSVGHIADEVFHKGIGSVAERSFRPHVNWSTFTPDESLLCACDLGIDQIKLYEFDHVSGKLKLFDIIRTQLESAPRQITFSPDGKFAYVVCELKDFIDVYSYDSKTKHFEFIQNIFTLRKEHRSNSAPANLIITDDGEHLLCSNAGINTVTMYDITEEGLLTMKSSLPLSGDYPKYIQMFPDGKHLISMNHDGNSITIFTYHPDNGLIVMNGLDIKISKPNNMVIKRLK